MLKYTCILSAFMQFSLCIYSQNGFMESQETDMLKRSIVPCIIVETENSEEPTCDYVNHPEGCMGATIQNATKVNGRMQIFQKGTRVYDSHEFATPEDSGMTIRVRGNTSAYNDKKPFKIHLKEKADLMFRERDSMHKDKDWLLITGGLINMTGFMLGDMLGMEYTPSTRFVNLILNNNYRGPYILIESVKRNVNGRINVDKNDGYIIEYDPYYWNEPLSFFTPACKPTDNLSYGYTFKYPESEDVTEAFVGQVQSNIQQFENSIETGDYPDFIDTHSFAAWLLAHDILGNKDSGGANMYLCRKNMTDKTSVIAMPCLWDFGGSMKCVDTWARIHEGHEYYFGKLFASANPAFKNTYQSLWYEKGEAACDSIIKWLDSIKNQKEFYEDISRSYLLDQNRWHYQDEGFDGDLEEVREWFISRKRWMKDAIDNLSADDTAITTLKEEHTPYDNTYYDLKGNIHGKDKSKLMPGIYIINKKKVIIM